VVRTSSDAAFGGLPLFGCGISLGGCVLVSAAHQMPGAFSGAVLLAPMLSLEKMKADPINAVLRPFASLLAWLVPSLPIVAIPRNTMFPLIQVCVCVCVRVWVGVSRIASPPLSLVGSRAATRRHTLRRLAEAPRRINRHPGECSCEPTCGTECVQRPRKETKHSLFAAVTSLLSVTHARVVLDVRVAGGHRSGSVHVERGHPRAYGGGVHERGGRGADGDAGDDVPFPVLSLAPGHHDGPRGFGPSIQVRDNLLFPHLPLVASVAS